MAVAVFEAGRGYLRYDEQAVTGYAPSLGTEGGTEVVEAKTQTVPLDEIRKTWFDDSVMRLKSRKDVANDVILTDPSMATQWKVIAIGSNDVVELELVV